MGKASNFNIGRIKIVRIFRCGHEKMLKTTFSIKRSFPEICSKKQISRLGPCESSRPELSENVVLIGRVRFWTGVIGLQRWMLRQRITRITRPQFWVLSSVTESAWVQYGWFHADSVAKLKTQNCGRVYFFKRLVFSVTEQFFRTHPSLTAYNSRSKPHTPKKYHIFGILRTWALTWT